MISGKEVEGFLSRLERQNKSKNTIRTYRIALSNYQTYLSFSKSIESPEAVESWLSNLEGFSPSSQRLYFAAVRTFYRSQKSKICKDVDYSFRSPAANVNKAYNKEQLRSIIGWFENRTRVNGSYSHLRDELIIKLASLTGARISEILNLEPQDVVLGDEGITLHLRNTKSKQNRQFHMVTKTDLDSMRNVALSNRSIENMLKAYLIAWKAHCSKFSSFGKIDCLFVSNLGKKLSYLQIRKVFIKAMSELKLDGTIHWIRHSFVTRKIEEGSPIGAVSQMVGHSSSAVTLRVYNHCTDEVLKKIAYNNLF